MTNCLIDLHLHLDGSLSLNSVKELAKIQDIPLNKNDDKLLEKLQVSKNCRDLNQYLTKFDFPCQLLQTKEAISLAVYNLQEELKAQGLMYAEIRFAPQKHTDKGLTQEQVVQSAIEGLNRSDFKSGLILCCMRGDNNHTENTETINVAEKFLGKGVCAVDLAGAEALFTTDRFEDIFKLAKEKNIPFTIHAGEAMGPESIYKALEFGAKRIGHGIRCLEDEKLVELLVEKEIPLELCPTSNLNTNIYTHISRYPLKNLMDKGIKVTINTDNMTVSNTTIRNELNILNLNSEQIKTLLLNSADSAFTNSETKNLLKNKINSEL